MIHDPFNEIDPKMIEVLRPLTDNTRPLKVSGQVIPAHHGLMEESDTVVDDFWRDLWQLEEPEPYEELDVWNPEEP